MFVPAVFAQSFEVASIKPAMPYAERIANGRATGTRPQFGLHGGPGTADPGLFTCTLCNVYVLVQETYQLEKDYQVSPRPSPSSDYPLFDIQAKVPAGATREQFRAMLLDLLNDRFKLAVHKEKRETPVYELVVLKGGPKFKESAGPPPERGDGRAAVTRDSDGFPVLSAPLRKEATITSTTGLSRIEGRNETMQDLAERLDWLLSKPVIDGTGLNKRYDYRITFTEAGIVARAGRGQGDAPGDPNTPLASVSDHLGMTIEGAIQAQLGLKLESKKAPIEVLVIDHAEKTPTQN